MFRQPIREHVLYDYTTELHCHTCGGVLLWWYDEGGPVKPRRHWLRDCVEELARRSPDDRKASGEGS